MDFDHLLVHGQVIFDNSTKLRHCTVPHVWPHILKVLVFILQDPQQGQPSGVMDGNQRSAGVISLKPSGPLLVPSAPDADTVYQPTGNNISFLTNGTFVY